MTIAYPSVLPGVNVEGYGYTPSKNSVSTDFESGPSRKRRLYRSRTVVQSVHWLFTTEQLGVFEYWYANEIDDGTQWFTMALKNGADLQTMETRFVDEYQHTLIASNLHQITANVLIRNAPGLSSDAYYAATQIGIPAIQMYEPILDQLVNVEFPQDLAGS